MERTNTTNSLRLQFQNRTFFISLEMQTFPWNLFQMNFHSRKLSQFID